MCQRFYKLSVGRTKRSLLCLTNCVPYLPYYDYIALIASALIKLAPSIWGSERGISENFKETREMLEIHEDDSTGNIDGTFHLVF